MIIAAYSERLYKEKLSKEDCLNLQSMLVDCNNIKIDLFSRIVKGNLDVKKLNSTLVINDYRVNTYYGNMIARKVKSILSGQKKLRPRYIEDAQAKIIEQNEKIEKLNQKLSFWRNMKAEIILYTKEKNDKTIFPYAFKDGKAVHLTNAKGKETTSYELWEFELYIEKRIRQIKNSLYHVKNKLNRLNQKLEKLQSNQYSVCFGTKAFFKNQFTVEKYIKDHDLWRDEFYHKRYHSFVVTGCAEYVDGSMCARYNRASKTLSLMNHNQGQIPKDKKRVESTWFTIPCEFKYREAEYLDAINNRRGVAYKIVDYGEYFIIKATFDYQDKKPLKIYDKDRGIVSLDINIDRYALTSLDKNANLTRRKVIHFNLDGLSSEQATKTLEKVAIEVSKFCAEEEKPLVREDIEDIKFKDTGDRKRNKQLTQFAYDKMITTIDRRLRKDSFTVYKDDPKFTSKQGKMKYMAALGASIHESAAFTTGRRFMLSKQNKDGKRLPYYEDLRQYKHFGSIKKLAKDLNKLSVSTMYQLSKIPIKVEDYKTFKKYVKAVNDYIYGKTE